METEVYIAALSLLLALHSLEGAITVKDPSRLQQSFTFTVQGTLYDPQSSPLRMGHCHHRLVFQKHFGSGPVYPSPSASFQ